MKMRLIFFAAVFALTLAITPSRATSVIALPPIPPVLLSLIQAPYPLHNWTAGGLKERPPVPPAPDTSNAKVLTERWIELSFPEIPYDSQTVENSSAYVITSADDGNYAAGVMPSRVYHRHFPEKAPYAVYAQAGNIAQIEVIYRIYLEAPPGKSFVPGKTYRIAIDPGVSSIGSLSAAYDESGSRPIIHVNQVAYPSVGPKIASLSWWLGDASIDFSPYTRFSIINDATGNAVYSGPISPTALAETYSGSDVYSMDFSSFNAPGTFHVHIPGIGNSYSFQIGNAAFNYVAYTAMRGVMMARDGNHGLNDPLVTHWNRPPAHLDDAIEESTGKKLDLVGGYMDAGDRSKDTGNMGWSCAILLSAMRLFPAKVESLGETLQIPESGNRIPDFVDEAIYAVDELYRFVAYNHDDGSLPEYVRPANGGYELGLDPVGAHGRFFFDKTTGHHKNWTLMAAGALAMAATDPLIKKYAPGRSIAYRLAALRAFNAFELHENDPSYWVAETGDTAWRTGKNPWSSEMVFAAANLLQATDDPKYLKRLQAEWPADPLSVLHWGIDPSGIWLSAFLSVYLNTSPLLPAGFQAKGRDAIRAWADYIATLPSLNGVYFPEQVTWAVGWFFSGNFTGMTMLYAWGVTGETKYRDSLVNCWNYLLGTNPRGVSSIAGLGDPATRPRWMVHEINYWEWFQYKGGSGGWAEPPPGIPAADIQDGQYDWWFNDAWDSARVNQMYPALSKVPVFYRNTDAWNATNEFMISGLAALAADALPLIE
jgi:hypothetical protein